MYASAGAAGSRGGRTPAHTGAARSGRAGTQSMDEVVDGIIAEKELIFRTFAIGLGTNMLTVFWSCVILMDWEAKMVSVAMTIYFSYMIYQNSTRIQRKFIVAEHVKLNDLTGAYHALPKSSSSADHDNIDLESMGADSSTRYANPQHVH